MTGSPRHRARWQRLAFRAVALAAALAFAGVVALGAVSWYFAGVVDRDGLRVSPKPDTLDLEVIRVEADRIELRDVAGGKEWRREGRYALAWEGGFAPVGRIMEIGERRVVREWLDDAADRPAPGTQARLDPFAFADDPGRAHGLAFREVAVPGPLGPMPAWLVDGDPRTWVIFVHGKGSVRREALRALPVVHAAGFTSLVMTYRNDAGNAPDPGGRHTYGRTEWEDLQAAAEYAQRGGAERMILYGYSMGAGIVLSFMDRSPAAGRALAIVLDSPMLSFGSTIDFQAGRRNVPGPVIAVGKRMISWRFGVDWDAVDYRDTARQLEIPLLLFHGSEDDQTPVEESDALAGARPDLVTYERVEGASHVRSWNVDPARYEGALAAFLRSLATSR